MALIETEFEYYESTEDGWDNIFKVSGLQLSPLLAIYTTSRSLADRYYHSRPRVGYKEDLLI